MSDNEYAMDVDDWSVQPVVPVAIQGAATSAPLPPKLKAKNAHLKGRKRFMADLEDLKIENADVSFEHHGLQVGTLKVGDEEGSIELKILRSGQHFIALNLLIDDTTLYPREHTFYSFAQDADIPSHVLEVIEKVSSASPKPLEDTVKCLVASIAVSFAQGKYVSQEDAYATEDAHDGESEGDDASAYDDDIEDHFAVPDQSQSKQFSVLRSHFLSVIEAGYKPGLTRLSDDEIVLSISSPVPNLSISPRALVAWDRRLLTSYHNLTLLISGINGYNPVLSSDDSVTDALTKLKFHVGLSPSYKPGRAVVLENVRSYGLKRSGDDLHITSLQTASLNDEKHKNVAWNTNPGRFEKFSLSSSLESLMSSQFLDLVKLRVRFNIGWAGAELLHSNAIKSQQKPEALFGPCEQAIRSADIEEARLQQTYSLPTDHLSKQTPVELNLPLLAYSYLVRRFTLCSRFCLVCHTQTATASFEALKPYVCDSKLCTYQYYALNFGPSIEYEICANPQVVDLLVSLTYASARGNQLSESLPIGLGLRVPYPEPLASVTQYNHGTMVAPGAKNKKNNAQPSVTNGLCDFDELPLPLMRAAIVEMIDSLPSVADMKTHLERKVPGNLRPQLKTMDCRILPAAWSILRWCVASSTAYLEEITDNDELVSNIDTQWRQFRFSVGAPDKEARYKASLEAVQKVNPNARKYPAVYAFHGSPLKNWHSIIRQGFLVKDAVHGRAYGDGVYFAKDGNVSIGYCSTGVSRWVNSETKPLTCVALAEIVNSPNDFASQNPYYVVNQVDWILCRYLLVKTDSAFVIAGSDKSEVTLGDLNDPTKYVPLDPSNQLAMNMKQIRIPEQSHKLQMLLEARRAEAPESDAFDEEDEGILNGTLVPSSRSSWQAQSQGESDGGQDYGPREAAEDWRHNEDWCHESTYILLPPPSESTPRAALALQKEFMFMRKEQEKAVKEHALAQLGWYMPPQLVGDNLFRWMLELHSFDPELPIAQDMAAHNVPSLLFEVRFPASFPNQPPFFRIIKPRFLPFIAGGGGHVTGGGSICMDLLVSDGTLATQLQVRFLPRYLRKELYSRLFLAQPSISAILLQIKLAISNLDPRPARLAKNWDIPYTVAEALEGFKRAARTHGWTIPDGFEKLVN